MARKQTIAVIVFLVIFVLLAVYIAVRTAFIYKVGTGYANQTTATVKCVGYMYEVSNINYSNSKLSFDLENKPYSRHDLDKINVFSEQDQKQIIANVVIGSSKRIEINDFSVNNSFLIAPVGCEVYGKTYSIR